MKRVLLLGATGSLGSQVFNYLKKNNEYQICALTGWFKTHKTKEMAFKVKARYASYKTKTKIITLIKSFKYDIIVNCIGGLVGIEYSWLALSNCKELVLGNKETLFIDGKKFLKNAKTLNVNVIPLDSELTTLWYMVKKLKIEKFSRLAIIASGGILNNKKTIITNNKILNHPIWKMGKQITIDSSTMINKIYEWHNTMIYFDVKEVDVFLSLKKNIHAMIKINDSWIGIYFNPSMFHPINMIFNNQDVYKFTQFENNFIKINYEVYPIFFFKKLIVKRKWQKMQLMVQSIFLGNLFLNNLFSFEVMINSIIRKCT